MSRDELKRIAEALGMTLDDLQGVAVDLFGAWLGGVSRYPTLSQQNQAWYRAVLSAAGKSNPSREDLKAWFGLPHGTAQYLAGVLYDPSAVHSDEHKRIVADAVLAGIERARGKDGTLGSSTVTAFVTPAVARTLEALLVEALAVKAQEPPSLTRMTGAVRVSFSRNQGLEPLCAALGDEGAKIRDAASS
jgi:hypothetical protein